ncbi:MAG: aspartate aminotransferase family protein, partial [Bdellovibrionota bacterium]
LELVKDRATKEPLSEARMKQFYKDGVKKGFLAMSYKPTIRIQPALNIDAESIDAGAALMEELFDDMAKKGDWK